MFRLKSAWRLAICLTTALLLLLPFHREVDAHAYSASYTTLTLTKASTEMTFALDELSVIELVGGDANKNGMLEPEEFDAVKAELASVLQKNITLKINGESQAWTKTESLVLDRKGDATRVIMKAAFPPVAASQPIALTDQLYLNDAGTNYVNLLTIQYGKQKSTAALSGKNRTWALQMTETDYAGLSQDAQPQQNQEAQQAGEEPQNDAPDESKAGLGWFSFFTLGMSHILTGYDHLLFLFSLLIARQTFKQYAAMITAFTIAHSITLSLTVFGLIDVPPAIVEPAIALSICYVALDNMIRNQVSYRWVLTFLFGLVHGMGFADVLKEMDIPRSELAVDLISFNIGIETVQVTMVAILLPLLGLLHRWKYSKRAVFAGSATALALGGIWLVERLFLN
ncbi:HupE/UreJ family protein [Paenibacillus tyrfis]|uniref:HupE/UreJ family protein n=1 Tax=Paenibacillus tyrfis TaxID=1501230 RepID=UPI000B597ABB|nr:HupE/UreJ family protein [Paenibacillus tyrfis]